MTQNIKNPCIAFVYFAKMTEGLNARVIINDDKPYAYLNNIGVEEGELALVHVNGRSDPFAVVSVARNVPLDTRRAAEKTTKPLIAPVEINIDRVRKDFEVIAGAKDTIRNSVRQSQIDEILGIDRTQPTTPTLFHEEKKDG